MIYKNRQDAAEKLIPFLKDYQNQECVVLAVPRGGVPIGYAIAHHYNFPLDLLLTKKIGHPSNPELAIGAVSLKNEIIDDFYDVSKTYINEKINELRENLKLKSKKFMGEKTPINLKNKTVIIVDDGIATGNTLLVAIQMIRNQLPNKIVIAVPVAPSETAIKIGNKVDAFICPVIVDYFRGVGGYYLDFTQVSDEEVLQLMKNINQKTKNKIKTT